MRVLFFAQLRDVTECESIDVSTPTVMNSDQLWAILLEKFPALANQRTSIRLSRNWEYASADTKFADADEVALIPPVSGG